MNIFELLASHKRKVLALWVILALYTAYTVGDYYITYSIKEHHPPIPYEFSGNGITVIPGHHMMLHSEVLKRIEMITELTVGICKHLGIDCWLESGTLLAAWRSGRIFDWEKDADIGLRYEDLNVIRTAWESGDLEKMEGWNENATLLFFDNKDLPLRVIDKVTHVYVDCFTFLTKKNDKGEDCLFQDYTVLWRSCYACTPREKDSRKAYWIPIKEHYPLKPCSLNTFEAMCPANTHEHLVYLFGDLSVPFTMRASTRVMMHLWLTILFVIGLPLLHRLFKASS
eukprot:m.31204 g.31204  ORF g.31204 m.31204 type:complete len:284 (-) comp8291_c0_seq2:143-994(-)